MSSRAERALIKATAAYEAIKKTSEERLSAYNTACKAERDAYSEHTADPENKVKKAAWRAAARASQKLYTDTYYTSFNGVYYPRCSSELAKAARFVELKQRQLEDFNERKAIRDERAARAAAAATFTVMDAANVPLPPSPPNELLSTN